MKKQKKNLKFIYLVWEDAIKNDIPWVDYKEAVEWSKKSTEGTIHQSGVVLYEDKEFITLASRWDETEDPLYGFVHRIPKTWIRARVDLTKHIYGREKQPRTKA